MSNPPNLYNYQSGYYSSHYAQAYLQPQIVSTTNQGYTLSSSFNSSASCSANTPVNYSINNWHGNRHRQTFSGPGPWYQSGNSRCTYDGCKFTGSHKSVEIHRMDRHLIYPPGWEKRKNKEDWDADPSLKGKTIPIQGTTVILDSPEQLQAWIEERKKRWPSVSRIEEKKRMMDEAITRGQLSLNDVDSRNSKRRKFETIQDCGYSAGRGRGNRRGFKRDRGRAFGTVSNTGRKGAVKEKNACERDSGKEQIPNVASSQTSDIDLGYAVEDKDEDAPEILSSKERHGPHLGSPEHVDEELTLINNEDSRQAKTEVHPISNHRPRILEPKKPPRNPFASRPTLLRNLLLPEIRITVSNLSQAIRFLVDNDFLEELELKPGAANEKMIRILD